MTDDQMDARLRAAGERWRNDNPTIAVVEPTTATESTEIAPPRHTRNRWTLLASAAVVAAALVAGGAFVLRGTHDDPAPTGDTAALEGHVWLLTDSHGTKSTATLYVDRDGNLVGDDECTLIGGKAVIDGNSMTVTDQIVRYKSCTDQYGPGYYTDGTAILDGASTFTITPDALTIAKNGKELRFELAPQNTPVPTLDFPTLVGANWSLVSVKDADGDAVTVGGDPTLRIDDDGTLTGSDGCNSLNGTVTIDGGQLTFGTVGGTEKYCPGDAGETEKAILAFMRGSAQETVIGGELTLTKGNAELGYRWQPQTTETTDPAQLDGKTWRLIDNAGTAAPAGTTLPLCLQSSKGCAGCFWSVTAGTMQFAASPNVSCGTNPLNDYFAGAVVPWAVRDGLLLLYLNNTQGSAMTFSAGSTRPTTETLVGPTWHLVSIKSGDLRYRNGAPPAEDSTLTLTGKTFAAHHICYTQQGTATTTNDTLTTSDAHAVDAHPCPFAPDRDHAAQVVDSILAGTLSWTIDQGTLTLAKGDDTLAYSASGAATSKKPLVGTPWRLETAVDAQGTELAADGQSLTIDRTGQLSASDGLNTTSGPVRISAGTLTFGDLATTAIGSTTDDPVRDVIGEVLQTGDAGYQITGDELVVSRGLVQLIYRG